MDMTLLTFTNLDITCCVYMGLSKQHILQKYLPWQALLTDFKGNNLPSKWYSTQYKT